jgi:hypothetical protein
LDTATEILNQGIRSVPHAERVVRDFTDLGAALLDLICLYAQFVRIVLSTFGFQNHALVDLEPTVLIGHANYAVLALGTSISQTQLV